MSEDKSSKKILLAPDSFKGSISAKQFCEIAKRAILEVAPNWRVDALPLADGGEGTVDAVIYNLNGEIRKCKVHNPIGEIRIAKYGVVQEGDIAIMEMAEAAGLNSILPEQRNPEQTSSFGVGEMILDAVDLGCKEIIMGIGGSATNDGGMGMLCALGYQFFGEQGNMLQGSGADLTSVTRIDDSKVNIKIKDISFRIACDVDNPLTGEYGATYIYGKQKGGNEAALERLEAGMKNYASVAQKYAGKNEEKTPGAGAAGGLGYAFLTFLNAKLQPGFDLINQVVQIEERIKEEKYDYIITGEGQMNQQTLYGKLPNGMALLGKKYNIPVIAVVGSMEKGFDEMYERGLVSVFSILSQPVDLEEAIRQTDNYLYQTIQNIIRLLIKLNQ